MDGNCFINGFVPDQVKQRSKSFFLNNAKMVFSLSNTGNYIASRITITIVEGYSAIYDLSPGILYFPYGGIKVIGSLPVYQRSYMNTRIQGVANGKALVNSCQFVPE